MKNTIISLAAATLLLASATMAFAGNKKGSKVIAHRGYWKAVAEKTQNSRAAMQHAFDQNFYGSETDVWITTDGTLMVNHDPSFGGVTIQSSTYDQCKDLTLSNGEKMPRLEDFLVMLQGSKTKTKLIIEIKSNGNANRDVAAAYEAVRLVKEKKLQKRVEYISFSEVACVALHAADPKAKIAYLSGDKAPAELRKLGLTGFDYTLKNVRENPTWIDEAHKLGLTVNLWTLNSEADIKEANRIGADYVTTNEPERARTIKQAFEADPASAEK